MKLTIEKELLLAVFDSVIAFVEINRVVQQKQDAVRSQNFTLADQLFQQEIAIAKEMPTLETMKGLREDFFNMDKPPLGCS